MTVDYFGGSMLQRVEQADRSPTMSGLLLDAEMISSLASEGILIESSRGSPWARSWAWASLAVCSRDSYWTRAVASTRQWPSKRCTLVSSLTPQMVAGRSLRRLS